MSYQDIRIARVEPIRALTLRFIAHNHLHFARVPQGYVKVTYYSYTLDSAANIPSIVMNGAGVGKLMA